MTRHVSQGVIRWVDPFALSPETRSSIKHLSIYSSIPNGIGITPTTTYHAKFELKMITTTIIDIISHIGMDIFNQGNTDINARTRRRGICTVATPTTNLDMEFSFGVPISIHDIVRPLVAQSQHVCRFE